MSLSRGHRAILSGASLSLAPGELVALLGPNGAGKTSLLRAGLGLERDAAGRAEIAGRPAASIRPEERARMIAYLPQKRPVAWPASVRDVVALGRFAYGAAPGNLRGSDREAVENALRACALEDFAERAVDTLSGGEEARVHCARAFAAETPLLLADEPAASLDPYHQHKVMGLFRAYVDRGGGALVVLHELSLAAQYADRFVLMKEGRIAAEGTRGDVLTPEVLEEVFGVRAEVNAGGVTTAPL